ncbi:hypothetical protein [Bradyrhizobium sp. SZCCHNR2026]|uniref:hypothetical protein n=1 Tax=Bradyrhizobium sp. SZCCHNR2026 TaxID=3057381 RepID=UPI002916D847|nr:hypothetical protein [Bradyrhizobium sp. SZCCHNR2026]
MSWIFDNAEKLGGIATALTACVALCALIFARKQIQEAKNSQREATAKDIYRDYLKLAFEHPQFANPAIFVGEAKGNWKRTGEWIQDEKYRWFVAFMLNSYDEICSIAQGDKIWHEVILIDFKYHKDYLKSREFGEEERGWDLFSPELRKIAGQL